MAMCKVSSSLHFIKHQHPSNDRETAVGTSWAPNTDVYLKPPTKMVSFGLMCLSKNVLPLKISLF